VTTLAETFHEAGYRTGAFTEVAWPLLQRGFDTFQNTAFGHTFGDPETNSAARTLQSALQWAQEEDTRPFFLLIHTYEVHSYFLGKPHHHAYARKAMPDYRGPFLDWAVRDLSQPAGPQVMDALLRADKDDLAYVRNLYRGAVVGLDAEVARFVTGLQSAHLDGSTVMALTSSNGEGFRPDLGRVHHGGRLHDDVLHVPLILRWPDHIEPGVVDSLVSLLDVAPTLDTLAGIERPPAFEGYPLMARRGGWRSVVGGPRFAVQARPPEPIVAEEAAFRVSPSGERTPAERPQYALYEDWVSFIDTGDGAELYDLKADPEQEHDRSAEHVKGVEGLRKQVRRIAESGGAAAAAPDAEQLEQLRSLGYVQ
jgi:arylsulfatase A-like enzyme